MDPTPDPFLAMRRELTDWRQWLTRFVVLAAAAAAGLVIVAFTWLADHALTLFDRIAHLGWWAPLVWMPLSTAGIVWVTRRFAPATAGSGIPQVMASLDTGVAPADTHKFVSLRLTFAKILLTAWGLLAGLSLGREGPSVQIAAGVMYSARKLLPSRSAISGHGLLVAGGAAGIAAVFNAPLAGVMFAIEELSRRPEQRSSGLLIAAIVLSGLIAVSIYGNATYFGVIQVPSIGWALFWPGLLVTMVCGASGGLFSRLLLRSLSGSGERLNRWRRRRPVLFAAACGGAVALIGLATAGATFGSGYSYTRALLDGTHNAPVIYALCKFTATWITAWSGIPGGLFAPALAIGAGLGNDVAALAGPPERTALIALGMVGFLAAVTQAPLTAFIIVMEMIDGHAMVLSLMACALLSSLFSKLIGPPIYPSLAQLLVPAEPATAPAEATAPVVHEPVVPAPVVAAPPAPPVASTSASIPAASSPPSPVALPAIPSPTADSTAPAPDDPAAAAQGPA